MPGWSLQDGGGRVKLLGLKSMDDLNGRSGEVGEYNDDTRRWVVTMDNRERVWVKGGNIEQAEGDRAMESALKTAAPEWDPGW